MSLCSGCGAEVVVVPVQVGAEPTRSTATWGVPALFERLMSRAGGRLCLVQHLCRDYVAWHRPVPDGRDVDTLDVPGDRVAVPLSVRAA